MWNTIGHDWTIELLTRNYQIGRVAHAYLFTGPAQIGKTTLAMDFARMVNCVGAKPPCGECRSCRAIAENRHPDVHVIGEEDASKVKIAQMRELQHEATISPYEGRYKVFVIPNFERATREAANSLLKTLEEPPARVLLLLTALDTDWLLPTITSRCQVLNLRTLSIAAVAAALRERWRVEPERAQLLAQLSDGHIGWAITAHEDEEMLQGRADMLQELHTLQSGTIPQRMQFAEKLSKDAERIQDTLVLWLQWWRDMLLIKGACMDAVINIDCEESLSANAARYTVAQIQNMIVKILESLNLLDTNTNTRLILEVLMLEIPSA